MQDYVLDYIPLWEIENVTIQEVPGDPVYAISLPSCSSLSIRLTHGHSSLVLSDTHSNVSFTVRDREDKALPRPFGFPQVEGHEPDRNGASHRQVSSSARARPRLMRWQETLCVCAGEETTP